MIFKIYITYFAVRSFSQLFDHKNDFLNYFETAAFCVDCVLLVVLVVLILRDILQYLNIRKRINDKGTKNLLLNLEHYHRYEIISRGVTHRELRARFLSSYLYSEF